MVTSEIVKTTRESVVVMMATRRVGPGQHPYLSPEDVRAELAAEVEEIPAAVELLAQILGALAATPVTTNITCVTAPTHTGVAASGRIGEDNRTLTVNHVGESYDHYPRTPDETAAPRADRPLSLAEVAVHVDPEDGDYVLLLTILSALTTVEPQMIVEAVSPAYWNPEVIVRTPGGDRLTITATTD